MEVIYSGIDQLDVAFQGALPVRHIAALQEAKDKAEKDAPTRFSMGGVAGLVKHVGTGGGYAFIFETDTETWLFKRNPSLEEWNIFAGLKSEALATDGFAICRDRLFERLEAFGARVITESLNRIDFAVDITADGFELNPDHVVCPAQSRVQSHEEGGEIARGGTNFHVERRGRRVQTLTVGKMPGRQVQIYDKRAEQRRPNMAGYWFDVWGYERDDCPPVWRVELRAGKTHLQDWNIRTFADLDAMMGDMFKRALADVRYVEHTNVTNITRAPIHEIWSLVLGEVARDMADNVSGAVRGRIVATKRAKIKEQYAAQIKGLAAGLSVVHGYSEEQAVMKIADDVAGLVGESLAETSKFRRTRRRASDRFIFLDDNHQMKEAS